LAENPETAGNYRGHFPRDQPMSETPRRSCQAPKCHHFLPIWLRVDAKYCSAACQKRARRSRKAATATVPEYDSDDPSNPNYVQDPDWQIEARRQLLWRMRQETAKAERLRINEIERWKAQTEWDAGRQRRKQRDVELLAELDAAVQQAQIIGERVMTVRERVLHLSNPIPL
jgi:hypothetical protein